MHDKFRKRHRASRKDPALRRKIAAEAARRLLATIGPTEESGRIREASAAEYYAAKRKAAAVLGHTVRPGDLPSDSEVREQILALARNGVSPEETAQPEPEGELERLADHVDRFAIYRLRLEPLEAIKLDPKSHPEGDALYHSLQVFEVAREERPFDEEFLLAALLHEVGRAIDPQDPTAAGLEALEGTLTERTAWLVGHLGDLTDRPVRPKQRKALEQSEWFEDLAALADLDVAGRVTGAPVGGVVEALEYLRGLEQEAYLE